MQKQIVLFLVLFANGQAGYSSSIPFMESRFSVQTEYRIMDRCVERIENSLRKQKAIDVCACALRKTKEDGVWRDYDDGSYNRDQAKFHQKLDEELKNCS